MRLVTAHLSVGFALLLSSSLAAQVLPPAPAQTPPSPAYEPPPPPAPPPVVEAPKPVEPLPSLVRVDENGVFMPLEELPTLAALSLLPVNDDERTRINAEIASRNRDIDLLVIDNLPALIELRTTLLTADDQLGIDRMQTLAESVRIFNKDPLLDRLMKAGLITLVQRNQCEAAVKEYKKARRDAAAKQYGHGNRLLLEGFRFTMDEMAGEAFSSLDRQIEAAAPKFVDHLASAGASEETLAAARRLHANAADAADRVEAMREVFFKMIDNPQRQAVLRAAATPMP